jgi:nitronate monooxygenase
MLSWPSSRITPLLGLDVPIVLGPFGGGLSNVELAALVSEAGGLGSFGAQHLSPDQIGEVIAALRSATGRSFAVNLWVSTHDIPESKAGSLGGGSSPEAFTRERFDAAVARLLPLYEAAGVSPPPFPERFGWTFEEQLQAILAAAPPALSFVYGIPSADALAACRERGIATIGTAITVEEAVALDEAGVDAIVASGFEAGGHRIAFLASPEESLVGTMALIPATVDSVEAPVIAAGGIADARGVEAAQALGAEAVQIGTAFLATDESAAAPAHKELILDGRGGHTRLTRAFTGRLARGVVNQAMDELGEDVLPFPYQAYLVRPFTVAARRQDRTDISALWAGQAANLVRHRRAAELLSALTPGSSRPPDPPLTAPS